VTLDAMRHSEGCRGGHEPTAIPVATAPPADEPTVVPGDGGVAIAAGSEWLLTYMLR